VVGRSANFSSTSMLNASLEPNVRALPPVKGVAQCTGHTYFPTCGQGMAQFLAFSAGQSCTRYCVPQCGAPEVIRLRVNISCSCFCVHCANRLKHLWICFSGIRYICLAMMPTPASHRMRIFFRHVNLTFEPVYIIYGKMASCLPTAMLWQPHNWGQTAHKAVTKACRPTAPRTATQHPVAPFDQLELGPLEALWQSCVRSVAIWFAAAAC
jgi:hypothetical protein